MNRTINMVCEDMARTPMGLVKWTAAVCVSALMLLSTLCLGYYTIQQVRADHVSVHHG